ncbi:hypothetical protein Csa_005498 [Cucumis sativus]|uniref:Uncharacterized protein n=2 Tax=Cucumis sativus TaxID=3659 RepID=A0A0A0K7E0_CUCSA|nr:hypothetical protein Csa_005498 [Cucumis sativus]
MFSLENLDPFLDAIYILSRFGENANIECSPSMFSLIVPHHNLELNVAFQMMPQFFNYFFSNRTHSSKIPIQPLFNTIKRMKEYQITSLSFFVLKLLDRLVLKFSSPRNELPLIRKFRMRCAVKEDMGNIDLETFVSIDSQQFRRVVTGCRDYFVRVTTTHSHVRFSNEIKEFIFAREGGECIMEGVGKGKGTEFLIPIYPTHVFYNITFRAKRVWLFKSIDKLGTFIVAPVGLFARFVIYFPLG